MRADGRQAQRCTAPLFVRPAMHETMVQTKVQSRVQTSQSAPRPSAWARPSFHFVFHDYESEAVKRGLTPDWVRQG